jgi:hypothetical protein
MKVQEILQCKVSFQLTAWSPVSKELTIGKVLEEIKSDKYSLQVNYLRQLLNNGDDEGYGMHKKTLPSITFCATFNEKRKRDLLKTYNSLIVIDIDKLSQNEFVRVKKVLKSDEYVFSIWESPSQKGLKGLVSLSYNFPVDPSILDKAHKSAFQKLSDYFLNTHQIELDESGSDTTRLCFLSFDPNTLIKETINQFTISKADLIASKEKSGITKAKRIISKGTKDTLFNPKYKNIPENRKAIQAIIKFLSKRGLSITKNYEEWYRVAYAIANSFTHEIGEKYYLSLCRLDGSKHDETNSVNMLRYCYENSTDRIKFNTIIYFANKKGYQTNSQRGEVPKTALRNNVS